MVKGLLTLLLAADTKGFNIKMDAAAKRMKRVRQATALAQGALIAFGAAAAVALGARAIRTIIQFDKAMVGLSAILGVTREQMKALEKQAISLGGATIFTAVQIGELQTILARFGFDQSEIEASTKGITDLAAAAGIDLAQAADTGAATLRAFRLEASEMGHIADVMTNAFTKSALTVESFADAMTYAAPIAAATNISLEETSAALAILADNGIRGSIAGTGLRRILVALGGEGKTIADIMEQAAQEIKLTGDATKYAKEQVGLFAIAPFLTLIENAGKIRETTDEMNEFGTASSVASQQLESIENKILLLISAWDGLIVTIDSGNGVVGASIKLFVDGLTEVLQLFKGLEDFSFTNVTGTLNELGEKAFKIANPFIALNHILIEWAVNAAVAEKAAEDLKNGIVDLGWEAGGSVADSPYEAFAKELKRVIQERKDLLALQAEAEKIAGDIDDKEQLRLSKLYANQTRRELLELYDVSYVLDEITGRYAEILTLKQKIAEPIKIASIASGAVFSGFGSEQLGNDLFGLVDPLESLSIPSTEGFADMNSLIDVANETREANNKLEASYISLGNTLSGAFSQGAQSMADYTASILSNLIDIATVAAIAIAAEFATGLGPVGLIALPAAIGLASGLIKTAINSTRSNPVTAFAEGGIVSGTTYGMLGEYASAGRDPEVVAPLSKLSGMLDQGSGTRVFGEFVLRGRTLVAAVNTENNRQNKYGG